MEYKISHEPPPVFKRARELWGVDFGTTIFTYGDTIHAKNDLSQDLIAHELVHVRQQTEMGVEEWWEKFFVDADFRLSQEVEAYGQQYKWILDNIKDRNIRSRFLWHIARALSGGMYGHLITLDEATKLIKENAR